MLIQEILALNEGQENSPLCQAALAVLGEILVNDSEADDFQIGRNQIFMTVHWAFPEHCPKKPALKKAAGQFFKSADIQKSPDWGHDNGADLDLKFTTDFTPADIKVLQKRAKAHKV
jgi:hypothetical protein